jgi:hypothetical protein
VSRGESTDRLFDVSKTLDLEIVFYVRCSGEDAHPDKVKVTV